MTGEEQRDGWWVFNVSGGVEYPSEEKKKVRAGEVERLVEEGRA